MKKRILSLLMAIVMVTALLPFGASAARKLPIYRVQRNDKIVAISFDAAWGDENTQSLLNILNRYGLKATFFLVSTWVDAYPNWVKTLADNGMEIMNHSNTHPHIAQMSYAQVQAEVNTCSDKIEAITGVRPTLFRCPYGEYNDTVIQAVRDLGVTPIQWDVDSLDWSGNSASDIKSRVLSKVQPGSIILFHNDGKHTPEALPEIIETLQGRGYTIVPVSQILFSGDYTIDATGAQIATRMDAPTLSMSGDQMTMTSSMSGAAIHYTTDGSAPTTSSTKYSAPVTIEKGHTVKAIAVASGYAASDVTSLTYTANGNVMRDVSVSDWYYPQLDRAVTDGILSGTAPEVMSPNQALTRAMLVTMIHRMAKPDGTSKDVTFTDVAKTQYYYQPVCWASEKEIVLGYPDNTFLPGKNITRAELCAMIARYLRSIGVELKADSTALNPFSDKDAIPSWAKDDMAAMVDLGIIKGYNDGAVGASRGATRAEAVTMLLRAADVPVPEKEETPAEEPTPSPAPSAEPTESPEVTPAPSAEPTESPEVTPAPSAEPTETPEATPAPSAEPVETREATPTRVENPVETPVTAEE